MTDKIKSAVIVILAALLLIHYIIRRAQSRQQQETITALTLKQQGLDSLVNAYGQKIYTQETIITGSREALSSLTDSVFALKKSQDRTIKQVIAYYKGISSTTIKEVKVPFVDTAYTKRFSDSVNKQCKEVLKYLHDSTIVIPRRFFKEDPGYRFVGTVTKEGVQIDSLSIPDTLQLRFIERGGFLKKKTVEVQYFHSNPYITSTSANSAIYKPPKKRQLLLKSIFFGAGVFLGTKF